MVSLQGLRLTSVVTLAGNILVAHQVHPISEAGHQQNVGDGVQRAQLVEGQLPVKMMDRVLGQGPVAPVDAPHDLVHHAPQSLQEQGWG